MTTPDPSSWPEAPPPQPPVVPPAAPGAAPAAAGYPPASAPPPLPTPAPSGPPPPGSSPRAALIAGIVAVLVVLGLAATFLAVRSASSTDEAAAPTTSSSVTPSTTERTDPRPSTTTPDPTPPGGSGGSGGAADIEAEVGEIVDFVEEERGLEFKDDVAVVALGADEFKARVLEEFESETESLETEGALLRAGGIVPADLDIVQSQLDLLGDGVLGFYDPVSGELVVRSDSAGPLVRSVIAHELTHALDDQHFDLDRPELAERRDGSDWAFLALVEGSAKRVEAAYLAELSPADQEQLETDQLELALEQMDSMFSTPLVLAQILMSPYDYGASFVDQLVAAGGTARLDDAFGAPPVSSEQVLDPARFDGDAPITIEQPPADGEIIDQGVLGELFTGFLLSESSEVDDLLGGIDPDQLDEMLEGLDLEDLQDMIDELEREGGPGDLGGVGGTGSLGSGFPPVATTDGWGGDRYVVWETGDQVCLRVDWVMDSPESLATFRTTVGAWAARDASVVIADPTPESVRATRCAPTLTS